MRTMLLSLKPEVYDKIVSGEKIYEHRSVFPDEPILAYLYVSSPVKAIKGKIILSNKAMLIDWKEKYSEDECAVKRIEEYLERYKCVMEINEFQETTSIDLSELRSRLQKFVVPQMYYFIDGSELLDLLEKELDNKEIHITHSFENITSDMICIH